MFHFLLFLSLPLGLKYGFGQCTYSVCILLCLVKYCRHLDMLLYAQFIIRFIKLQ